MTRKKPKKEFLNTWIFEPFANDASFTTKRMFGGLSVYVHGKMMMVLAESPGDRLWRGKTYDFDIWNGVMFPTEHEFHTSLIKEFKGLVKHPVLGKWLYLEEKHKNFENLVMKLAEAVARNDERFGIYPKVKGKR